MSQRNFVMASIIGAVLIAGLAFTPLMTSKIQTAYAEEKKIKLDIDIDLNVKVTGQKGDKGDKGDSVTGPKGDKGDQGDRGGNGSVTVNVCQFGTSNCTAEELSDGDVLTIGVNASATVNQNVTEIPPVTNDTQIPPVNDTDTGGNTTEPGGNTTIPLPEEPVDNQSNTGNTTIPTDGNTTNTDGNVTIPVEGNVTLPTDGNVTVPLENGSIDIDPGIGDNSSEPFNPASAIGEFFNQFNS